MARNFSLEHIESYPIRKTLDGWDEEYSSVDEFKQHLKVDMLSSEEYNWGWVFRTEYSSGHESNSVESSEDFRKSIAEKITNVLRNIVTKWLPPENSLVQFWEREEVGGRCRLTTLHQPFAVGCLSKGVSWLRKKCMQSYYIVDDAADVHQLGPLGRVFRNGNPESSPDILLYSTKEFPLRDLVIGCCLKSYLALPIFDVHDNQCVGVLEFIFQKRVKYLVEHRFSEVDDALQVVGLRSAHKYRSPRENLQSQPQPLREIRDMLNLAIKSVPQLHLAQVWLPCNQCANNSCCMERKIFISRIDAVQNFLIDKFTSEFVAACGFHNIQNGHGIVGLVLSSTNKSYFCKNLSEFSITEYPMTHYARQARFSSCFAICPRNKHNGNDMCVFEFFLQPQSRDDASIQSILHFLLKLMEKKLKSFEISTERYFGTEYQPLEEHILTIPMNKYEETFPVLEFKEFFQKVDLSCSQIGGEKNITGFSTAYQPTVEKFGGQCNLPLGFENVQYGHEIEQQHSENQIHFSGIDDVIIIDQDQEQNSEVDRSSTSFLVTYDQLKSQLGRSRKVAAENLGVSISIFKRICRYHRLKRWPSRMNNIKNPSLFRTKVANKCVENADHQTSKPSGCNLTTTDYPVEPNISRPILQKTMELANTCQAADVIKAKFKDETLKFEFCVSRGVEKLMEEVAKRLNLKIADLKLKYADDDDGDLISLPCDEDLNLYVKTMKSIGKTTVQVLVHLISE